MQCIHYLKKFQASIYLHMQYLYNKLLKHIEIIPITFHYLEFNKITKVKEQRK